MRVLYLRRRRLTPAEERQRGVRYAPLDELLRKLREKGEGKEG